MKTIDDRFDGINSMFAKVSELFDVKFTTVMNAIGDIKSSTKDNEITTKQLDLVVQSVRLDLERVKTKMMVITGGIALVITFASNLILWLIQKG